MPITSTNSLGQTQTNQYDIQRQQIRDEEARRKKENIDAMKRRLASQGLGTGTGYGEAQQRKYETALGSEERSRLAGIDTAQLAAQEASTEAAKARTWQTGERTAAEQAAAEEAAKARTWQTGESQAARESAAQQAELERQFQTGERVGTQEFASQQAEADRQMRQQEIDNAAINSQNRLEFDYWAQQAGYTDAERERAWKDRQATLERNATASENQAQREFQLNMAGYQEELSRGTMELQSTLQNNNAQVKQHYDYLYQLGQSNVDVDTSGMNQDEVEAYNMGKAGRLKEDYDNFVQSKIDLRNQLILTLVESPDLKDDITRLWGEFERLTNQSIYGEGGK